MCNYVNERDCSITGEICPYVYWCNKKQRWLELSSMPKDCKVKVNYELPKGQYLVIEERKGYLYVDVNNQAIAIKNPFNFKPKYVELYKTKTGWAIRGEKNG